MQTCRRHPNAGRFITTCPGCAQELHDTEARNRAQTAARTALASIGTPHAEILTVHATPTTLIVATRQPDSLTCEFAVDVFRLPTPAESDPDLGEDFRFTAGQWHLDWQAGDHTADALPHLVTEARQHLTSTCRITHDTPTVYSPAPAARPTPVPAPVVRLLDLPGAPELPATQADADKAATAASNAFWDHAENCQACLDAQDTTRGGTHCRTGYPLAQAAETTGTIAVDFADLDRWYRHGGRERHNASDWIAA